nr:hypothetical protein Itr_chr05CG09920 [Ipomoea trifida]
MVRTKEIAKKRKFDQASFSHDPAGEDMQNVEEQKDAILGARTLKLTAILLAKVEKLKTLQVLGGKYFDPSMLDSFGCTREVEDMIFNPQWSTIFSWRGDTYNLFPGHI